jgi:putative ABC transport system permease protein
MNIFSLAWRNLFRNSRRTLASLITVALGASGLLIYQGFKDGIMNQYRENTIRVRYGHGQVFQEGYYSHVHEKPWEFWIEDWQKKEADLLKIKEVRNVFPRVSFYSFIQKGEITLAGKGEGTLPERESVFFNAMNFESGGNLEGESDIVLGKGLAHSINAKVGDSVTLLAQTVNGQINGGDYIVKGVFHTGVKEFDDQFYRIHLKSAQSLLDVDRVELFALETSGAQAWPALVKSLQRSHPNLEAVPFEILDKVYYQNSVDFLEAQFSFIRTIIILIVALGIFNTIAMGLLERSGEVGALRANGESRGRLFRIYILENILLGFVGGILGCIVAVFVDRTLLSKGIPMPPGPGITRQFIILLEIAPKHFAQGILLPALATVLASILPIRKLLNREIADLLRAN